MNRKAKKTWRMLLVLWVIYWVIIFILPQFNLILRGSYYSILFLSSMAIIITLKVVNESTLIDLGNIRELILYGLITPNFLPIT